MHVYVRVIIAMVVKVWMIYDWKVKREYEHTNVSIVLVQVESSSHSRLIMDSSTSRVLL